MHPELTPPRIVLYVTAGLLLVAAPVSAQESDTPTGGSRSARRPAPGPALGYGLGSDPVAERYLTSLEYQDLRLNRPRKSDSPKTRPGEPLVSREELAVPEKARQEARKGLEKRHAGEPDLALKHLWKAVGLYPQFARAYVQIAMIYRETGRMSEAEETLVTAEQRCPSSLAVRKALGYLYIGTNRPGLAVGQLSEAVRLDPADAGAKAFLGDALFRTGSYDQAESVLKNALVLDPKCYPAAYRLSALYTGMRKFPEAIALLEQVLHEEHPGIETRSLETLVLRLKAMAP